MFNPLQERIEHGHYALFFCLAITLHNVEESIWLPRWSQSAYSIQQPVSSNEFHFAVLVITALAYLTAFFFVQFAHSPLAKYAFSGFLWAMILNTFFPHALSTIVMKAYAPRLLTGLLLIVPIHTFILYQLHKQRIVTFKEIVLSTIIVGAVLLLLIPTLFVLANRFVVY
ncbi:MAG: HXXEE domain-containing protein [Solibacillus sp.]